MIFNKSQAQNALSVEWFIGVLNILVNNGDEASVKTPFTS
jgi:hypothetical protein